MQRGAGCCASFKEVQGRSLLQVLNGIFYAALELRRKGSIVQRFHHLLAIVDHPAEKVLDDFRFICIGWFGRN